MVFEHLKNSGNVYEILLFRYFRGDPQQRIWSGGVCPGRPHGVLLSYKGTGSMVLLQKPWRVGRPHTCAHTPYLAPSISSIWLFLNCIMYNKLTLESEVPSWVLSGISSESSNLEKGLWEPLDFIAGQWDIWLAEDLKLASEVGTILWDWAL